MIANLRSGAPGKASCSLPRPADKAPEKLRYWACRLRRSVGVIWERAFPMLGQALHLPSPATRHGRSRINTGCLFYFAEDLVQRDGKASPNKSAQYNVVGQHETFSVEATSSLMPTQRTFWSPSLQARSLHVTHRCYAATCLRQAQHRPLTEQPQTIIHRRRN